ncbi:MAG: efflux RND transporter periplasmic adaptor subunit [Vicinamibacterales bacterium]
MNKRNRSVALVIVGSLVAALGILSALVLVRDDGGEIQTTTAEVMQGTITRQVLVTGTLRPLRTVDTGTQVSGTIQSIEVDFNTPVRAGQVVARLDPAVYQAQLMEAEGQIAQAQAEHARLRVVLDDARTKLGRAEELAAEGLIPRTGLEQATVNARQAAADVKATEASIAAAKATVAQAQVSLNHTVIRSPIDGVVVSRLVEVGQTVAASVQAPVLFNIADLRRMQLLAEVSEADVGGVRSGSTVSFKVESIGDQPFTGTVKEVRLQPLVEQAVASTSGNAASTPASAGTAGTSAGAATSTGAGTAAPASSSPSQPAGASSPGGSATQPTSTSTATSTPASSSSTATATAARMPTGTTAASGVITYTAVIDVDNSEGTLNPGGTALITLNSGERQNVVRIPNNALSFNPSVDVLAAADQQPPVLVGPDTVTRQQPRSATRQAHVWRFENRKFVAVPVEVGLSNGSWTELVKGPVRPGDVLVTAATAR